MVTWSEALLSKMVTGQKLYFLRIWWLLGQKLYCVQDGYLMVKALLSKMVTGQKLYFLRIRWFLWVRNYTFIRWLLCHKLYSIWWYLVRSSTKMLSGSEAVIFKGGSWVWSSTFYGWLLGQKLYLQDGGLMGQKLYFQRWLLGQKLFFLYCYWVTTI